MNRRDFLKHTVLGYLSLFIPPDLLDFVPYVQHGDPKSGKIAITIDDGWETDLVKQMIDTLDGTPATFFPVGTCLKRDQETYAEAIKNGYVIFNHTWEHPDLDGKGVDIWDQLVWWEEAYSTLGVGEFKIKALRPPGNTGANNPHLYKNASKLDYLAVYGWSVGSRGVFRAPPADILNDIKPYITSGSILLFHFVEDDIKAMPQVIKMIKDAGLSPVTLYGLPGVPTYQKPITKNNPLYLNPR